MHPDTHVIVFAKAPVPGQVKTRLIPTIGANAAARLAERLLNDTLDRVVRAGATSIELCCAPDASHPVLRASALRTGARLSVQQGADLGARMGDALRRAIAQGRRALLIGTDCPALDWTGLTAADNLLDNGHDAVFIPARDGGYALIGIKRFDPALFANIAWGSDRVMAETEKRLATVGWRWAKLASLPDIDRPEDLTNIPAEWYA